MLMAASTFPAFNRLDTHLTLLRAIARMGLKVAGHGMTPRGVIGDAY